MSRYDRQRVRQNCQLSSILLQRDPREVTRKGERRKYRGELYTCLSTVVFKELRGGVNYLESRYLV